MTTSIQRLLLSVVLASVPGAAQWFHYPTAGVPRKADGSVNMTAPAPRLADGKPDFSGIWMTGEPNRRNPKDEDLPGDQTNITASRQMANLGVDLQGGLPYQAWQLPIVKERTENMAIDDPHIRCFQDTFIRAYGDRKSTRLNSSH